MKKSISLLCAASLLFVSLGCSSKATTPSTSPSSVVKASPGASVAPGSTLSPSPGSTAVSPAPGTKLNLPSGTKETGSGTLNIVTTPSTSNNPTTSAAPSASATTNTTGTTGTVPVVYVSNNSSQEQITLNVTGFDTSKQSFIFIDGILNSKQQLASSPVTVNLTGNQLTLGTHKVEVVQYATNTTSGKLITYKIGSYEVKQR